MNSYGPDRSGYCWDGSELVYLGEVMTGPSLKLMDTTSLLDGEAEVVGRVWRDCQGKWWAAMGCGCVLTTARDEEDARLWVWDRREHGH